MYHSVFIITPFTANFSNLPRPLTAAADLYGAVRPDHQRAAWPRAIFSARPHCDGQRHGCDAREAGHLQRHHCTAADGRLPGRLGLKPGLLRSTWRSSIAERQGRAVSRAHRFPHQPFSPFYGPLQRATPADAAERIREQLPSVWLASLKVFPAAQAVAYRLLPPTLWLPFFNLVGLLFGVYVNATRSLPPSGKPKDKMAKEMEKEKTEVDAAPREGFRSEESE